MQADKDPETRQFLNGIAASIVALLGVFGGLIFFGVLPAIAYRFFQADGWEGFFIYLKALLFLGLFILLPTFVLTDLPALLRRLGKALKNSQTKKDKVEKNHALKTQTLPSPLCNAWFKRGICLGALIYWLRVFFLETA